MVVEVKNQAVRPPCVYRHFVAILDVKRPVLAWTLWTQSPLPGLCEGHSIGLLCDYKLQVLVNRLFQ